MTYKEALNRRLQEPEFKKEWDSLEPEFQLIKAMLDAREKQGLTQRQLSEKTGITQADICKMENGEGNPTIQTLKRLADGLGMTLTLAFTPRSTV